MSDSAPPLSSAPGPAAVVSAPQPPPAPSASPPMPVITKLFCSLGFDTTKRNNLMYIDDDTLIIASGNTVQFFNVKTAQIEYLVGRDGGGIGSVAVHPSRKYFAVAEKGNFPNIYIYEYPSLAIRGVLPGGTEQAYSHLVFDQKGEKLASVGSSPDFMLTIWNWEAQSIILRSKAFGQEVFRVSFSPYNEGQLTSCGTGHIKFWKMARTFTGLKLQGQIGKFGKVEISDVAGYAELPDGKVISGSENGSLLLWYDALIKVEIRMPNARPCHEGMIEVVMLQDHYFITAGHDGWIRFWKFDDIDTADTTEDSSIAEITPVAEIMVDKGVSIRSLTQGSDHWIVQDANGALWRLQYTPAAPNSPLPAKPFEGTAKKLAMFHSGSVVGVASCPIDHVAATAGSDGTIRLYDYQNKKLLFMRQHAAGASKMLWAPLSVDNSGRTIVVGFVDGVVRVLKRCSDGFELVRVLKPHTQAVSCLGFSPDGKRMATSSTDGTIFFFDVSKDYEPIGFLPMPSPVTSLDWKHTSEQLLTLAQDGLLREIQVSEMQLVDPALSFELKATFKLYHYYQSMKPPAKPKPKEGEEANNGGGPLGTEPEEEEEDPIEKESRVMYPGLCCSYYARDRIIVSAAKSKGVFEYSGQHWESDILQISEEYAVRCLSAHNAPARFISFSSGGRFFLIGGDDGLVTLRPMNEPDKVYACRMHDSVYGHITAACTSFDDAFLFTVANDGCVFVHNVEETEVKEPAAIMLSQTSQRPITDITETKAYSIQEAKLKADEDAKLQDAENKKQVVRRQLDDLRKQFSELLRLNEAADQMARLERTEFDLDPELRKQMESENEEKIEIARKELAWYSAKCDLQLSKMKGAFLDNIEVEHIVLHAFKTGREVWSFVTPSLSSVLRDRVERVHELIAREEANRRAIEMREAQRQEDLSMISETPEQSGAESPVKEETPQVLTTTQIVNNALNKVEARKQRRQERQRMLEELMSRQPDEKFEDSGDVARITHAQQNMGDLKMKTDDDYVVPDHLRVNVEKKTREMVLLEESIHTLRMDFNERLLALRDLKRRIVDNIKRDNTRIQEINTQLGAKEDLFSPIIPTDETPEKRTEMTKEDLLTFEEEMKREEARKAAEARQKNSGGFGGFGGGGGGGGSDHDALSSEVPAVEPSGEESKKRNHSAKGSRQNISMRERVEQERQARANSIQLSSLENELTSVQREKLNYEKARLKRKIAKTVDTFDEALDELRRERFKLEADLKNTDMRLLVLNAELALLKDFEKRDIMLAKKLDEKRAEKADIVMKLAGCQEKLAMRKVEIERLLSRERQLMTDFNLAVGENNPRHEDYVKVFRKKVKRKEKKEADASSNAGSDAGDDSDEDFSDLEELEEEEEEEGDGCPPGCDPKIYDKIVELRDRRLEQEEALNDFQKAIEALKRENEGLVKKEKDVDKALKSVEKDIQVFQNEKQRKLNELEIVIMLKLHQIQYLDEGHLPQSLSNAVIFTNMGLTGLRLRIKKLQQEKSELRRAQKDLRKDHSRALRERRELGETVDKAKARVVEMQLLKFGQEIDIEALENASIDRVVEELKQQLKIEESHADKVLKQWEREVQDSKEYFSTSTQENTRLLEKMADLVAKQQKLEGELDAAQKTMLDRVSSKAHEDEKEEREKTKELIIIQAREIEAIKTEINILRSKGGHVYSPVPTHAASR